MCGTACDQVYPHIATGFSDTSAFLRELTLKSMLVLAPKLSQRNISGSLLKYLSKLQVDEEPAIRTNTTILLGNLASHLNEGTRKRVLINAFTVRALRDTFPPARGAGIMALCATSSYYDAQEIAARILPNVVVLIIDPDSFHDPILFPVNHGRDVGWIFDQGDSPNLNVKIR
ncbi:Armadillo-like helical [Cynara cardunculus var. scolymus]|uniref:Armadillo-like helical n=1 Tax=Cynara cardunculus var. scolymus TaxID=59895 RepID=A0A103YDH8_CYNCS|nr:Armadillo-like helical [Cynara cardunculus var. scolymus]